jgi:hypothetical protein
LIAYRLLKEDKRTGEKTVFNIQALRFSKLFIPYLIILSPAGTSLVFSSTSS